MKTTTSKYLLLAALSAGMAMSAGAILITPSDTLLTGTETGLKRIYEEIIGLNGPDLKDICLYKANVEGTDLEEGSLAGNYTTTFSNSGSDPQEALIVHGGGNYVGPTAYLLVKDGRAESPNWYLFNLTALGWNGTEDIELQDFWPNQGAISHVSLYGENVPDGGTTVALLGLSLLGLGGVRRLSRVRKA